MGKTPVKEIMEYIKTQVQESSRPNETTSKNIILLASLDYRKNLSQLDPENLKYIAKLDSVVSKEETITNFNQSINPHFNQYLLQANMTYDIQTTNKIETSKPKWIRKWVLKFRNIIQL